jgi:tetratricopeptide (TPR) repeat protein
MKRICSYLLSFLVCLSFVITSLYPCASFAGTCKQWVAKVVSVQGNVQAKRVDEKQWQPVKLNNTYCPGDVIRVQEKSRAEIALINQPVLRLDQNTTITIEGLKEEKTSVIGMLKGAAHFFSRAPRNLAVHTAFVNAGVEGTEFFIRVEEDKTLLSIFEGKVLASNEAGSLTITSGQSAVAEKGKAPVMSVVVRPRDAVQWALYYPPVLYYHPSDFQDLPETEQAEIKKSIESYIKGDISGAFESIAGIPEDMSDKRLFIYRASLLLSVGRVDEAKADIDKALTIAPGNSDAFALQSIIAVVQNEKEKALNLAKKSVEANPKSSSARIALSYAQQASFDLQGALDSLKDAVKLGPENALAWARLAELWQSFGKLDEALKAAKKAVALNPNLSRTQTVLGFAYLTLVMTGESKVAFQKAIELDQADPLPRLGLGLAKIRESDLNEGRREIEIAASLDPDNSLIRSYLGKAYFEEKHDKLSMDQFEMSKKLDPLDPTPFFYDAIRKQTTNRPVEALHDMQKAIELNDNRAIYRSRLLLDEDLAARSASLARIYSDLGFQQLALVEGWKSVNTDPSNFSAHRFLADSYSVLPRHEIARVSELLQSQLLQPINITPIQPRLAESNLFLISAGGPGTLSFNEFNPLFNRDQISLQASGIFGDNSTAGEEAVVSGIYRKASFSMGQFHYETDGFRKNNDQNDNIANAFLQLELSPNASIQAEYRYRDIKYGDLQLMFFKDDFLPNLKQDEETNTVRLGSRLAFSPSSVLISNVMYQKADRSERDEPLSTLKTDLKGSDESYSAELQYLFRSNLINIVSGAGSFVINSEDKISTELTPLPIIIPFPPFIIQPPPVTETDVIDNDVKHFNAYLYSYINLVKNLTFTVGASGDFYDRDIPGGDKNQFNPKFGITWNPFPDTTLRGAVFRTLKRTLITDQTLEPTQVAGFNQFFDEDNATESWNYGGAIDQKFTKELYGGAQYTFRNLVEVPYVVLEETPTLLETNWKEKQFRAYLFWTPHKWLALSAEWLWERSERNRDNADGAETVETNFVPLGINFYHPSGLGASLKGTYTSQHGSFEHPRDSLIFKNGKDDFWLVDAAISYRLPKRYGFITVGATNLFDKEFQYFETDRDNPRIQPGRFFFARLTLSI